MKTNIHLPMSNSFTPAQRAVLNVGKGYVHQPRLRAPNEAGSRVFCNASTEGTYTPPRDVYCRNDGHKHIHSRGVRC